MVAACGVTVSVVPCMIQVFGPCIKKIMSFFGGHLKRAIIWLFKNVVVPFVTFLHNWGLIELGIYMFTFQLVYEGYRMDQSENLGKMTVIFGLFGTVLAILYSTFLHALKLRSPPEKNMIVNMIMVWVIFSMVPIAICIKSVFLGYMVFIAVFTLLGFRMVFFGLGIGLGWDDDETMERSATTTFSILTTYIILRLTGLEQSYLYPFRSAICVLGGNILFLALLIMSSKYYQWRWYSSYNSTTDERRRMKYVGINLLTLVIYGAGIGLGAVYSLDGIKNSGITYLVIWLIEKYQELYFLKIKSFWFFLFSVSAFTCWGAFKISRNPEFVVKMFKA
jgi:hypothetical protein